MEPNDSDTKKTTLASPSTLVPKKKLHMETWGCQMNVADSERMTALMAQSNFEVTDSPENADLIVLNTCHIREKAKHKVISRLGRLRSFKTKNPDLKIAVTGCVAQAEGKKLLNNFLEMRVP